MKIGGGQIIFFIGICWIGKQVWASLFFSDSWDKIINVIFPYNGFRFKNLGHLETFGLVLFK